MHVLGNRDILLHNIIDLNIIVFSDNYIWFGPFPFVFEIDLLLNLNLGAKGAAEIYNIAHNV